MGGRRSTSSHYLLICCLLACTGCSSSGGTITIFPTGDYLLRSTKQVRRSPGTAAPIPRELEKTVVDVFVVQPGDTLVIEPIDVETTLGFPSDQTVMVDGTLDLGKYGRRVVAGMSVEQIEQEIKLAMTAVDRKPAAINVRLGTTTSALFYVLGEVNSPGSFPLIGRETVLDAIVAAGGLTDRASPCNIILSRPTPPCGCRIVLPICYRHLVQLGDTSTNYQLMPGDRVFVATRTLLEQLLPCGRCSCPLCNDCQCPCADPTAAPNLPGYTITAGTIYSSAASANDDGGELVEPSLGRPSTEPPSTPAPLQP